MPRLVRRQPLIERLKSKLDPYDFLLWLSEELDSTWLEQFEKEWAFPAGIALNLVFAVARANSRGKSRAYDDVFGDDGNGGSLLAWVVCTSGSYICMGGQIDSCVVGFVYRPDPYRSVCRQRSLYILAQTTLPAL